MQPITFGENKISLDNITITLQLPAFSSLHKLDCTAKNTVLSNRDWCKDFFKNHFRDLNKILHFNHIMTSGTLANIKISSTRGHINHRHCTTRPTHDLMCQSSSDDIRTALRAVCQTPPRHSSLVVKSADSSSTTCI